jgi:hypothetical protein
MAMIAGSVSVTDAGVVTKSGMAEAIYDQMIGIYALVAPAVVVPSGPQGVPIKRAQAMFANAMAAGITGYIIANAKARIAIGQGGLQKTPNPNTADTATVGPIAAQDIAIV